MKKSQPRLKKSSARFFAREASLLEINSYLCTRKRDSASEESIIVLKACLFGSYSRGEQRPWSDPLDDTIKSEYIDTVDAVGQSLQEVVKRLHEKNPDLNFQLVIEGNAAIPWQQLHNHSYNPDNVWMYELSYHRALALYRRWLSKGVDLRHYNTEVIIAGSGFNGINRDNRIEENNKRFVIQIIPKISRSKQVNAQ